MVLFMATHSAVQLATLARISFWGLDTFDGFPNGEYSMAHLNTPQGVAATVVNRATARRLARDELIAEVPESEDPDGLPGRWRVTSLGTSLLRANSEYLAAAGREQAETLGRLAMANLLRGSADAV
jgi:hypothetical protein